MTFKQILLLGGIFVFLLVSYSLSSSLMENNDTENYQIVQGVGGEVTIRDEAGLYFQNFAKVTTYKKSGMLFFSKTEIGTTTGKVSAIPIGVRFSGGSRADIEASVNFQLPQNRQSRIDLHQAHSTNNAVINDVIKQYVINCVMQTASTLRPEEAYSSKRAEFIDLTSEQIRKGIFETITTEAQVTDESGKTFIDTVNKIRRDESGAPMIKEVSPLTRYGIELVTFNLNEIDFDELTDNLIAQKKEAQQKTVVSKAKAEEAKQNAITAFEEGRASIARAKADEEVGKIKEVTQAEKNKAVAILQAEQEKQVAELGAQKELNVAKLNKESAAESAQSALLKGKAEADVAKLKVTAGLTPLEAATIEKDRAIGIVQAAATFKPSGILITGGDGKGGSVNPLEIMGFNALLDIGEKNKKLNDK